jgi:toxin ParE1/3/4
VAEVIWTDRALADVEAITAYIGQFSPIASRNMASRLLAEGDSLELLPLRGRVISANRRELTIVSPYLIRYRIVGDRVLILEVRHGARRPD